jgi:hypothetical protein
MVNDGKTSGKCVPSNGTALTVAALADAKRLPIALLRELGLSDLPRRGVAIPYYGLTGEEIAVKRRTALKASEGSFWPKEMPLAAYGQWRLEAAAKAGFLILVEGESDCWALWHHGLPALGLPGANTTKALLREHVEAVGKVYIVRETDRGGEAFVEGVRARLAFLGFLGKAFQLQMPDGLKDPGDLHVHNSDRFKARLDEAILAAARINLPSGKQPEPHGATEWEQPVPLGTEYSVPSFPLDCLPAWLCDWAAATAEATQTPADLAAMLAIAVCGAALARRFRVRIRPGWPEPTNLFTVVTLPPGDRKSAVFTAALAPVHAHEKKLIAEAAPKIAELNSEHRMLAARLKATEDKAAKSVKPDERDRLKGEAKDLARELAAHVVPEPPELVCDDVTPEKLAKLLGQQGGRILQASPEGTAFEIAKGRYSEAANFDVYLKGHAGDDIRVGRISRPGDVVEQPALSLALAVQPDVLRGLADQASMRGRGFLARFLYGVPVSWVGGRTIKPAPVPESTNRQYAACVQALWALPGAVGEDGKAAPHWLNFSPEADQEMERFESWLEPQLKEGEVLSHLAGWANKLAGAVARIAAILHVADAVSKDGARWQPMIGGETVAAAVRFGRDYLLPHAMAAFGVMGADGKTEDARHIWESICRHGESSEYGEYAPLRLSRRDIHQLNRRRFQTAESLDPVLDLLVKEGYLRPVAESGQPGKGHKSPIYEINPLAVVPAQKEAPRTHRTHRTHTGAADARGESSECGEDAPLPSGDKTSDTEVL